jgi:HAD superfamily hydrolase (TIGR01459 family)
MEHLNGLAPLVPHYDGYIIDLWGVVHDGVRPYPGAIDCLARLKAAGKRAVLLSNAPRRSAVAQAAMRAMGIPDSLYFGILTSGEATHQMLAARNDPFLARLGRRMFHLGPETDRNVYEGLDLEVVDTPEAADFVLNTGPDETRGLLDLAPYEDLLRQYETHAQPRAI